MPSCRSEQRENGLIERGCRECWEQSQIEEILVAIEAGKAGHRRADNPDQGRWHTAGGGSVHSETCLAGLDGRPGYLSLWASFWKVGLGRAAPVSTPCGNWTCWLYTHTLEYWSPEGKQFCLSLYREKRVNNSCQKRVHMFCSLHIDRGSIS